MTVTLQGMTLAVQHIAAVSGVERKVVRHEPKWSFVVFVNGGREFRFTFDSEKEALKARSQLVGALDGARRKA